VRFLRRWVLLRMARPHRQAPEPEPAQHRADAALGQGHIEPSFDHAGQIHPAPTYHAVHGRVWPFANQIRHQSLLLRGEARFRPACHAVAEPADPFGIVAQDPVAQGLPVHAAEVAGFSPLIAFENQSQRQHPPR
jgi:hypothetical protein